MFFCMKTVFVILVGDFNATPTKGMANGKYWNKIDCYTECKSGTSHYPNDTVAGVYIFLIHLNELLFCLNELLYCF